ncbi:MAG: antibiotic biosynthesis monooxygenase [Comamonas sp.]|nr:antibiotic biosynthesis monooxygenase [Comamonas sp.]
MSLHVLATFVARPDTVEQLRPLLLSLVEPIRQDPGCTRCHLVSNNADGTEFVFVEEWLDEPALERHLSDAFIAGVVQQAAPLLAQPLTLHRYTSL